jgi:phosphoglycolate phosphatase-like HAD superfamily hydrolase
LRAIVFDFDGVILESHDIKTEAFLALFAQYPEKLDAIRSYHLNNVGISRFVKFEHIVREILRRPYTEEDRERLGAEFARLTHERILACPEVPGAQSLLPRLGGRVLRIVASGTPEEELRQIVRERGIADWFDEVWGTPRTKTEILRDAMTRHGLPPPSVLMVGDGMSDYKAACEAGVGFLARAIDTAFNGVDVEKVRNLEEMGIWLEAQKG